MMDAYPEPRATALRTALARGTYSVRIIDTITLAGGALETEHALCSELALCALC